VKTAAQAAAKWKQNAGGASQAFADGVANTQKDVVGNAIRNAGAAVQNYSQAITSGRWAAALNAVGNAGWKAATAAKAGNYTTGINASEQKFANAMNKLIPFIESQVSSLPARQPGNVAANVQNRVLGLATALHAAKGQFKG
jgi:hypothetical protein